APDPLTGANMGQPGGPPIFLSASYFLDPQTQLPVNDPITNTPFYQIAGAAFEPSDGSLNGYCEGISWKLTAGSVVKAEYGIAPETLKTREVPTKVVRTSQVNGVPVVTLQNFKPHSSPFLLIPPGPGNIPPTPGNPGPQQRFNPRDYPWVVRYF